MTIYCYLRVSTDAQDHANQRLAVERYCQAKGYGEYTMVEDKASGAISWEKRRLGDIMRSAKNGDVLIVSEVSRLARSTLQVLQLMEVAAARGLSIRVVSGDMVLDNGLQGQIHATVLAMAAQVERHFISIRAKQGAANAKAQGRTLGRPRGAAQSYKLDSRRKEIEGLLAKGVTKANVARICVVSRTTLNDWLKRQQMAMG